MASQPAIRYIIRVIPNRELEADILPTQNGCAICFFTFLSVLTGGVCFVFAYVIGGGALVGAFMFGVVSISCMFGVLAQLFSRGKIRLTQQTLSTGWELFCLRGAQHYPVASIGQFELINCIWMFQYNGKRFPLTRKLRANEATPFMKDLSLYLPENLKPKLSTPVAFAP